MALELKLKKGSVSSDGTILTLLDDTGDYNVSTNPTGYGTPNPARSSLYLVLNVSNNKSSGWVVCDYSMLPNSYNTVSTWNVEVEGQGWYQGRLYGLTAYNEASTMTVYTAYYKADTNQIVNILTAEYDPNVYTYEVIDPIDLDRSEITKTYEAILQTDVISLLCACVSKQNEECVKLIKQGKDFTSDRNKLIEFEALLNGGRNDFYSNEAYSEAQLTWECLESKCKCFTDLTCNC